MKSSSSTAIAALWMALSLAPAFLPAAERQTAELDALVARHQWGALRDAIAGRDASLFYRGAVAAAFNDAEQARESFAAILSNAPKSELAYEAYRILSGMYLRLGQHRRALAAADAMLAIKPNSAGDREGRALLVALSRSPDQSVVRREPSRIQGNGKDGGNPTLPMRLNGHPVNYVIDANANISAMSESDAARAGLSFHELPAGATKIAGTTGVAIGYRVAVAETVIIGSIELANVAFLVFPDDQEPWNEMRPGERGAAGISVLVALETCRWNQDGSVEAGFAGKAADRREANIWFDGLNLMTDVRCRGTKITLLFDTGADETNLWPPFATEFARVVEELGRNDSKNVRGIGQELNIESKTLPELTLRVGGFDTVLRPAHVLLKPTVRGSSWFHGRLGFDLLHQARGTTLDFRAMTLVLE